MAAFGRNTMNNHPPSIRKELINYVRLEESDEVAELLTSSSFKYVGAITHVNQIVHYWSYPTETSVAWVYQDSNQSLGITHGVPLSIIESTQSREGHKIRKHNPQTPAIVRDVSSIPVWIPANKAPVCNFYPVWTELIPFGIVREKFKAKAKRHKIGSTADLDFCVKLTNGRYAIISSRETAMHSIVIYLELGEDKESATDENCIGFANICDIRELLAFIERPFVLPAARFPYEWR